MKTCLTFDIEYHGKSGVSGFVNLLSFIDKNKLKSTFFVNVEFLKENKSLFRNLPKFIEIASHAHYHSNSYIKGVNNMNDKFLKQTRDSKRIIEKITGRKVYGFRAPKRVISKQQIKNISKWYKYDSSNPMSQGIKNIPYYIGKTLELPVSINKKFKIPAGFRFFRILPLIVFKKMIPREYFMMYFHNWEFEKGRINKGEKLFKKLNDFINYMKKYNAKFMTAYEIYNEYKKL